MHKNYSVEISAKSKSRNNQEKVKPLLEVLKATRFAGAIFTYHFENNKKYSSLTFAILDSLEKGIFKATTSTLTLLEILVKPKKENNQFISERYKLILQNFPNLEIKSLDNKIAEIAASIRGKYNINTPDAIQIATALHSKADVFITNDFQLQKITEIKISLLENML